MSSAAIFVLAIAATALVAWAVRRALAKVPKLIPLNHQFRQQVTELATAAGYESFGDRAGTTLMFRSPSSWLKIEWDRGYVQAEVADRVRDTDWVDDDVLRQVLFGEDGHPQGVSRQWDDADSFIAFLGDRLSPVAAAVTSADPAVARAIIAARNERARRLKQWFNRNKRTPE